MSLCTFPLFPLSASLTRRFRHNGKYARLPLLIIPVIFLLTACGSNSNTSRGATEPQQTNRDCPPCPACPSPPESPPEKIAQQIPPRLIQAHWSDLPGWAEDETANAWPALLQSCDIKTHTSAPWQTACQAARQLGYHPDSTAVRDFFEKHFTPWQGLDANNGASGLATGYYEPLIKGSLSRNQTYHWPVYGVPDDMITIDLTDAYPELKQKRLRGRLSGEQKIIPYWTRGQINQMQDLPAPVLLWAADPIDLFFMQVQGSGQVELPDGKRIRLGYADQNGHPYHSIGKWLIDQGALQLHQASMQGIKQWAQQNPQRLPELLAANPSYIFFREMPSGNQGPVGAQGVPLTPGRSIAVDPAFTELGTPVFLSTTFPLTDSPMQRLVVAQDTGSAIKGLLRADFFWGFGEEAGIQAGKMKQPVQMWFMFPNGIQPDLAK